LIDVAWKDLPARSVMQFDDVAFGMLEDLHRSTFTRVLGVSTYAGRAGEWSAPLAA
jgi:hypothetical protein